MVFRKIRFFVGGMASIALMVLSVMFAKQEFAAYKIFASNEHQSLVNLSAPTTATALSIRSDNYLTKSCLTVVTSVRGRVLLGDVRTQLLKNCRAVMKAITDTSPNNSFSWFMLTYLEFKLGNIGEFNSALARSYTAGPSEQWIAELRVPLAESAHESLSEDARAGHQSDLALLVQSQRGINTIVRQYVKNPDFRGRITSIVETLPDTAQRRFVSSLQRAVLRLENGI